MALCPPAIEMATRYPSALRCFASLSVSPSPLLLPAFYLPRFLLASGWPQLSSILFSSSVAKRLCTIMTTYLWAFLLLPLLYIRTSTGEPTVAFPFNAQLPPAARIGSLFAYSFPPHTFQSDDSNLTYSLGKHPSWLSLEGSERRLYGIPEDASVPSGEVVGQSVQIIATDDSGSATMDATIVVSRDPGPTIKSPISEQIKQFGDYSAPSSILSYPATAFKYTFDNNTFQRKPGRIHYYAVSGNSSPLPAWIHFDAASLTFSGKTPAADALSQPPQKFDIRLVASDIEGFSSISVEFSIVVGSHKLTTDNPVIELNASRGSFIEYDELADGIKLDGESVRPGDLNVTTANLPGWLSFDPNTWVIKGKPGNGDHTTNFTLRFTDPFSDSLNVWAMANVATGLFETTFHDVEATPGENFSLDLASHFKDPSDIEVKLATKPGQDWLKIDDLEIKGKVPKSSSGKLEISIQARSRSSGRMETETLGMTFLAVDGSTTTTPTTTTSTPSETARESDDVESNKDQSKENEDSIGTSAILLATIIPILAVALLIMLLVCFIRRGRNRRTYLSKKYRSKISHPVLGSLRVNGSSQHPGRLGSAEGVETHVFKAGKASYVHANSHRSSRSSDTLGSFSPHNMSQVYMHNAGPEASRTLGSAGTEEGRESWFTVDRTTVQRSETTRSRGSEVTVPHSTHQLLTTPPFLAQTGGENGFRSGLDLTIPSLDELPSMQPTPDASYQRPGRSTAMYSTITTSSAALPPSRPGSPRSNPLPITTAANIAASSKTSEKGSSDKDWSTIHEDESGEKVPELPPPSLARLSSHQWLNRRTGDDSWTGRDSLMSVGSFGSTENWRVIGAYGRVASDLSSYKEIVESGPFHPSRPDTPPTAREGAQPGERGNSPPPATVTAATSEASSKWVRPKASHSRFSKLNDGEKSSGWSRNWRREDSGKASEGSFKVFI